VAKAKPKKPKKPKRRPAWLSMVPGGKVLPTMTLEQLRSVKEVHALLTETFPGPPVIGYAIRSFRFCKMFVIATVVENTVLALTRCWKDLERLFMRDAAFREGYFVPSWILFDFPCDTDRRTPLDHFETFLDSCGKREPCAAFLAALRETRLGLYQEVLRTESSVRYAELLTECVLDVFPSIERGEPGEIVLGRVVELEGRRYFWGDVKAFPAQKREMLEDMVADKLFYFADEAETLRTRSVTFMRSRMSCSQVDEVCSRSSRDFASSTSY
jgi:hypothetical protein